MFVSFLQFIVISLCKSRCVVMLIARSIVVEYKVL